MLKRLIVGAAVLLALAAGTAQAETDTVRVAIQPGMSMLPVVLMKEAKLLEKELASRGLAATRVTYEKISGGPSQNDALLSGSIDFATGGTPAMLLLWDKTRGSRGAVLGIASLASLPQRLFTRNPAVQSVKDFTERDRIAVPALKAGLMPILLEMEAAKIWGADNWNKLDHLMVQLPHAEATAMLAGSVQTEITAHFSGPPQMYAQARDPKLRMVLDSTDITGGPITQNAMWARRDFLEANPKITEAMLAALDAAMKAVRDDPLAAVKVYLAAETWRLDPEELAAGIREPGVTFETTPVKSMFFADFMKRIGLIRATPEKWQDLWIAGLRERKGS